MGRVASNVSGEYRDYLRTQLRRTLSKRRNDPGVGARLLIDRTIAALPRPRDASVLCVGCRNSVELDEFRRHGAGTVVGIDLFSQRSDIVVMDMHRMSFQNDSFDAVYSSHSLEHSYEVESVAAEIGRVARDGAVVAIEVPVRTSASAADRIVFEGVADVRRHFEPFVGEVLWEEEQPPGSETNEQGSEIARLVFRVHKPTHLR
jgi:SAM-dependent methyltransferase